MNYKDVYFGYDEKIILNNIKVCNRGFKINRGNLKEFREV